MTPRPAPDRQRTGQDAEREAEQFLCRQGLQPMGRNVRAGRGEIDLLMQAGNTLVFVEVRARAAGAPVSACETITARKQHILLRTATQLLQQHPEWQHRPCRFDVVAITVHAESRENTVHWLPNAFDGSAM